MRSAIHNIDIGEPDKCTSYKIKRDKYTPLDFKDYKKYLVLQTNDFNGLIYRFQLKHGLLLSVVKHDFSYGHDEDLFEIAYVETDYIGSEEVKDVRGWLSNDDVLEVLKVWCG